MQHPPSDGAAAVQHSTKRRDARKAKLTQLFGTTATLFGDLETITALCWATHKLLTGHGLEQQSRTLAAHVQVLQGCCDANRELLARYDLNSKQHVDTDNPTDTQPMQQEQGHAGQLPAHPPQILQILHGSTSASCLSSNSSSSSCGGSSGGSSSGSAGRRQPGAPPPPPPLPPGQGSFLRPIPGKPRLLGSAAQQAAQGAAAGGAKPPPPPPRPPPPHKFLAAAAAAGPGGSSDSRSSSSSIGGLAPPPPPPGPPPPHAFKTKEQPASTSSTTQQPQQQQQRQGLRPPPPPLPAGALSVSHTPVKLDSSSPAPPPGPPAAAGGRGPGGGQPAGKAPPPPPPLPPLGFNSLKAPSARPSTAPGACSSSSSGGGGPGSSSSSGGGGPGSSSSRSSGGPLQGINAIAAAAAAAGARRAQQDGGTEPNTPTRATGLLPHSSSFSGVLSPPQQCTTAEGGSSCGKLKRLHVDPVPHHRMTDGSFWRQTEDVVQPFKAEVEYALRCMFSNTPAAGRRAADGTGGGPDGPAAEDAAGRVIKVIPDKRALQVEVCIKRLRMDAPELAAALNRIDTDKLKQDDLPQIRSMLPKPDELTQVTAAKKRAMREHSARLAAAAAADGSNGDGCSGDDANKSAAAAVSAPPPLPPRLGVVEAAFEALGGVRMLMAKMRACEFKYDVEAVSSQVDDFVRDLSVCLDAFRTCGQLQDLLAFVRSIANTMNASSAAGQAEGLKLESLARLQATRVPGSTDLNMLHFIVAQLTTSMPYALELEAEREAFKAVTKRGTFDTMLTRVRGLADMHKRISGDLTKAREHLKHTSNSPQQPVRNSSSSSRTGDAGDSSSSPGAAATGSARATKPAAAAADGSGNSVTPRPPVAAGSSSSGSGTTPPATPAAAAASPDAAAAADAEQQQVYVERVTQLLADSGVKLDAMQHKMDDAIRQFRFTVEYFCEDAALGWKQQPAAFIAHFSDLLEAIEAARKDTGRVAKVLKIVTQHIEDKARKEEEEADAAAAAAAAAAAESGVQLGWDGDEQQQQQLLEAYQADYWPEEEEQQQQHVTPCYDADSSPDEAPTAEVRLTRTSSWVLGIARSLQFDASMGSTDAAEGELLLGGGEAGSCCGDCGGEEAEEAGAPPQRCLSGDGSTARHSGGSGGGRVKTEGADSEVQQQQQQAGGHVLAGPPVAAAAPGEQQRQQQQEGLVLPDLQWQGLDLLSGIWGSSTSVLTPDEQDASARNSSNGSAAVGGDAAQKCAAAPAAAALDGVVP